MQFEGLDSFFADEERRRERERAEFRRLVERVKQGVAREARRTQNRMRTFTYHLGSMNFRRFSWERCTEYLTQELERCGFRVRLFESPPAVVVSWEHYVPRYAREQIRERSGLIVDDCGRLLGRVETEEDRLRRAQAEALSSAQRQRDQEREQLETIGSGVYSDASMRAMQALYQNEDSTVHPRTRQAQPAAAAQQPQPGWRQVR